MPKLLVIVKNRQRANLICASDYYIVIVLAIRQYVQHEFQRWSLMSSFIDIYIYVGLQTDNIDGQRNATWRVKENTPLIKDACCCLSTAVLTRHGLFILTVQYIPGKSAVKSFSVDRSLTAVRQGARVPSTTRFFVLHCIGFWDNRRHSVWPTIFVGHFDTLFFMNARLNLYSRPWVVRSMHQVWHLYVKREGKHGK